MNLTLDYITPQKSILEDHLDAYKTDTNRINLVITKNIPNLTPEIDKHHKFQCRVCILATAHS